jgi:hypothetical protein
MGETCSALGRDEKYTLLVRRMNESEDNIKINFKQIILHNCHSIRHYTNIATDVIK